MSFTCTILGTQSPISYCSSHNLLYSKSISSEKSIASCPWIAACPWTSSLVWNQASSADYPLILRFLFAYASWKFVIGASIILRSPWSVNAPASTNEQRSPLFAAKSKAEDSSPILDDLFSCAGSRGRPSSVLFFSQYSFQRCPPW